MTDPNLYTYQTYDTQGVEFGATNVLPTMQGTTEVLPAIGGDFGTGFIQGENTVLQDTAGLGGTTTTTGYLGGTTTDTNTFFGTTQEYPVTTTDNNTFYGGEQVLQTTTQPTTYFGETQVPTTDNNAFFTGVTTTDNTALYGTPVASDGTAIYGEYQTNAVQGTTQMLPATNVDANTFFAGTTTQIPGTVQNTTTTTTTQTTYGLTGVSPSPIQTTFEATQVPTTNQVTTTAPLNAQTVTTTEVKTNVIPSAVAQNQTIQNQGPVAAQIQDQLRKSNQPPQPKLPGGRVYDEDFRRGRPVYNDRYGGSKYEMPRLMPRPVYKTGANDKIIGVNQVNPGLSKLEKGYSYDIRGPSLLNKVGLGQINNNLQLAGQNQKTIGNIKDFL